MILSPAGRFLTDPRPPGDLAARRFAAVMRPPRLFFAICSSPPFMSCVNILALSMLTQQEENVKGTEQTAHFRLN